MPRVIDYSVERRIPNPSHSVTLKPLETKRASLNRWNFICLIALLLLGVLALRQCADGARTGTFDAADPRASSRTATITYGGETWRVPAEGRIDSIEDARILPPNGRVRDGTRSYDFGKWYWNATTTTQESGSQQTALSDPVLTLVQVYNDVFQHVVFDTLPKLAFACPFLAERPLVRVLVMNALQRDLVMEACSILTREHFLMFESAIRAPVVYVPYFEGLYPMGVVPPNSVRSLGSQTTAGTDVVYLARKSGAARSVANEDEVLAALRSEWPDLRVVYPANDWRRDRESVRNASVIIGPHGGALANMVFAPANTIIVEFTPLVEYKREGRNERPCYFGLAHGLGFGYHAVAPSEFDFDGGSMVVSTERLARVLDEIRTRRAAPPSRWLSR